MSMRKVGNGLSRGLMQAMSQGFDDFKTLFTNKLVKFHNIISAEKKPLLQYLFWFLAAIYMTLIKTSKNQELIYKIFAHIFSHSQSTHLGYFHKLYALFVGIPPKALCALAILVKTIICDRKSAVAHRFNLQIK